MRAARECGSLAMARWCGSTASSFDSTWRAVRTSSHRRGIEEIALSGLRPHVVHLLRCVEAGTKPGGRRLPAVQLCAAASTLRDPTRPRVIPDLSERSRCKSALEKSCKGILPHSAAPIPERWRPPAIRRPQSFAASKVLPAALAALESQCG